MSLRLVSNNAPPLIKKGYILGMVTICERTCVLRLTVYLQKIRKYAYKGNTSSRVKRERGNHRIYTIKGGSYIFLTPTLPFYLLQMPLIFNRNHQLH